MSNRNKDILETANAAVSKGDNEGFLVHCAEHIVWTTMGEPPLRGKQAVREWMQREYAEPPKFVVEALIVEGDWVVALGEIAGKDDDGDNVTFAYSDVWRFEDGKIVELRAFVTRPVT